MAYYDKMALAKYIFDEHLKVKEYAISPLKLQKSLFLLYAMWGGNARFINHNNAEGETEYTITLDEDLFEANFEAWKYGPVDRDIYKKFKEFNEEDFQAPFEISFDTKVDLSYLKPFIDHILEQVFEISDFSLVDLTHMDRCWKDNYQAGNPFASKLIPNEEIKEEYYRRVIEENNLEEAEAII